LLEQRHDGHDLSESISAVHIVDHAENRRHTQCHERHEAVSNLKVVLRMIGILVSDWRDLIRTEIPNAKDNRSAAFNGSSWVATRDRHADVPGPGWQLLASAGKRGPRGERGPIGYTGADAPRWTSISFDAKRMSFTTRMSDGSLGPEVSFHLILAGVDVDPATYSVNFKMLDGSELKFSLRGLFEQFFHELKGC
jgi:hypothetical protein